MSNANRSRNAAKSFVAFSVFALVLAAAIWVVFNRQYALDVVTNWMYEPSSAVSSITDRTELTETGKFVFYATRPDVLEKDQFNDACPRQEEGSPILGCYTTNDRIFVYNVTDEKLDGIKEVTAAHEVLHAVWQRLSESEKDKLAATLKDAYAKKADDALKSRMEYYERTEPGEFVNELHSILGTEVRSLGDELESYYSRYFDREKVLELHAHYSQYYTEISTKAEALFAQMQQISVSIDSASKQYTADVASLRADVDSFNNRANSGGFDSTAQFNAERSALIARSNQLEADRAAINANIAVYNGYHDEYQKLSDELQLLNNSMDSYNNLEEAPSV